MIAELQSLAYRANLSGEEMDEIFWELETEQEYEERRKWLLGKQISPLVKIRNGETLRASEINEAVKQAANDLHT